MKSIQTEKTFPSILQSEEEKWKEERNRDLEFESRQDFATWERDGDTGSEAE